MRDELFCFVLFDLQLSACLCWHYYHNNNFPTLKFVVVMADLLAICWESCACVYWYVQMSARVRKGVPPSLHFRTAAACCNKTTPTAVLRHDHTSSHAATGQHEQGKQCCRTHC